MGPGCANSPERKWNASKVSELLNKRVYGGKRDVLLLLRVRIGWIYLAAACLQQFHLQTGSKAALLITCAAPLFLVSQIVVQRSAVLWAFEHSLLQWLQKSHPWFGRTLHKEKSELKCAGLAKMVLIEMEFEVCCGLCRNVSRSQERL